MTSLVTLLNTDTTLWAGALLGLVIGALVGGFAAWALAGRRHSVAPAVDSAPDTALLGSYMAFVEAADTGHNSLLAVDHEELADVELEDALESDNPGVRRLAQSILSLASLHNELRLSAPTQVLARAETLFEFLTHSAMDGVTNRDAFSEKYQGHKSEFIAAARKSLA